MAANPDILICDEPTTALDVTIHSQILELINDLKRRHRVKYNPTLDHDYSEQKPTFREISPGHFVSCNDVEFARYQKEYGYEAAE